MPNTKEILLQQYPYKIELHAHTSPASCCADVSPEDAVQLYKSKGYDAIVLTNHFLFDADAEYAIKQQMADYYRACEAGEKCGLKVLLGAEIRFSENNNDYLLYGVNEDILRSVLPLLAYDLDTLRKNLPLTDTLLVQAHPFRPHCQIMPLSLLDGVEVFNLHPHHNSNNHLAQAVCDKNPVLIPTAGSDYHHNKPGHCGSTALLSPTLPDDSFALADILKCRNYLLQLHKSIFIP